MQKGFLFKFWILQTYITFCYFINEERVLEIAQMLSGANPGDAAMQHARDLLG